MGEKTGIAWTDCTFNPWIGCTKVSAGCANCYAETLNNFHKWSPEGWGKCKPRKLTSDANWKEPIKWAKKAVKDGVTRRVFCASLADVFDDEVPYEWRLRLFNLIYTTMEIGGLEWLILTKRPENLKTMLPWMPEHLTNIRIGVTCENQEMVYKRILELLQVWHGKNFISIEPTLERIDIHNFLPGKLPLPRFCQDGKLVCRDVDWVICGCESGSNARPMNIDWARSLRDQCQEAGTPFFLKQMVVDGKLVVLPELDGRVWSQFPEE